jgi:hypothetical protein
MDALAILFDTAILTQNALGVYIMPKTRTDLTDDSLIDLNTLQTIRDSPLNIFTH